MGDSFTFFFLSLLLITSFSFSKNATKHKYHFGAAQTLIADLLYKQHGHSLYGKSSSFTLLEEKTDTVEVVFSLDIFFCLVLMTPLNNSFRQHQYSHFCKKKKNLNIAFPPITLCS